MSMARNLDGRTGLTWGCASLSADVAGFGFCAVSGVFQRLAPTRNCWGQLQRGRTLVGLAH